MKFVRGTGLVAAALIMGCDRSEDEAVADISAPAGQVNSVAAPGDVAAVELQVNSRIPFGQHLADASGRSLYVFTGDRDGASNCEDECIRNWPPLIQKGVIRGGREVQEALIGTTVRDDGVRQVTYAGRPLYYYIAAKGPASAAGQAASAFGGEWFLVSPTGEPIRTPRPGS